MTPALRLQDVSKSFTTGRSLLGRAKAHIQAVQPLTLDVAPGETLGIVGESGCGKSTLARMIVGLEAPTTGRIEIEGQTFDRPDPAAFGRAIQYIFQDTASSLNPRRKIRTIMEAPLIHLQGMDRNARRDRIGEIFAAVNLRPEFLDRFPHEFSGGQAQRIGIARALAASPRILVLDEPVSALDVSVQAQVLNLLADLKSDLGLTYLFISHDLAVVEAVSERVAVMYFGALIELGAADRIFARPRHPYTRLLAESAPTPGRPLRPPEGNGTELPDPLKPPPGCAFAARCPRAQAICHTQAPALNSLEEDHDVACHHPLDA